MRIFDPKAIDEAVSKYKDIDYNPFAWVEDKRNIALQKDEDVSLFEYYKEGCYFGHYFFTSRGKKAVEVAKAFLEEIFSYPEVTVIQGLTPLENLGARWMNKKLGFTSYGVVETNEGPCEQVILTRQDYTKIRS